MTRHFVSAIAVVGLLAGCATVGETMADKEPSAVIQSDKTTAEYRACIVLSQEFADLQITDHEGGFMFVSTKVPGQVFTAVPALNGSTITVWGLLGTRNTARQCQ